MTATRRRLRTVGVTTPTVTAAVAASLLLAACSASPNVVPAGGTATGTVSTAAPDTSNVPPPSERNPGSYSAVTIPPGQIDAAVAALPALAEKAMATSGIPGLVVGVVHDGKVVFAQGYGVRELGKPDKVDVNTVFQLASLSKAIGATVVAKEVEKGTVSWDTTIKKNLPNFELADPYVTNNVTIADMYSHRSGLPGHSGDVLEDLGFDQATVLSRLKYEPLNPFRAVYEYTNYGLTAAGESVAAAAKTSWADLSKQDIYGPLGMTSTSSTFADFEAQANKAHGHAWQDGKYTTEFQRDPDPQSPAGGVSTNMTDYTKWMSMVLGNGTYDGKPIIDSAALTPAIVPEMITGQPADPASRAGAYGFGFNVGTSAAARVQLSHSGQFGSGAGTAFNLMPSENLGIAVFTNARGNGTAETVIGEFTDLVQFGKPTYDWAALYANAYEPVNAPFGSLVGKTPPASPTPARPDSAYVGTYSNKFYGDGTIETGPSGLQLVLGPKGQVFPLTHWDGETFTFSVRSENAEQGSISKLTFGGSGSTATSFVAEYFDKEGNGTFTR